MSEARKPNHLIDEKSPYLQQHAMNPVDWYPWGEEALRKARNDGKPIFLSIGYSTCHWCHVLERESFEDAQTAALLNKNFIPIKVDREERPEVDAYYMKAVQAMTGSGGWPLSVFLTPDLKPYYGGTYFPPEPRHGMPSFRQVVDFAARLWKDRKGEISETTTQITKAIADEGSHPGAELTAPMLDGGFEDVVSSFDPAHGGFGVAPKFPIPVTLGFLLRYHHRTGREMALRCVLKTLDEMMAGGIRDHVGGGFHRYSTDRMWLVPHFEKMLYDNALLAKLYLEAHLVTGEKKYAAVAREGLDWIGSEMTDEGGGFYSAQDADTEEGEGVYYTWTPAEVKEALGDPEAKKFCAAYGVTQNGNFEGRSILHTSQALGSGDPEGSHDKWMREVYKARSLRPKPATDTKVLTSWNGLCISAFSQAAAALDEPRYLDKARKATEFILNRCSKDGKLLRSFAGGQARLDGTLEDYAFFTQGLLDLFEATGEPNWLKEALRLAEVMCREFEDKEGGGFFLTSKAEPAKLIEAYDGPAPSGNSVAIQVLLQIGALTGSNQWRGTAEKALRRFGHELEHQPSSHANMLAGLDLVINGEKEVVITGRTDTATEEMRKAVSKTFHPEARVLVATERTYDELLSVSELLLDRRPGGKARGYVCVDFACKLPSETPEALVRQLSEK